MVVLQGMETLIVIDQRQQWPFEIPGAAVMTARRYLAEPDMGRAGNARVLNLCRTGRYQGRGYYVSLLAEARGQRPLPDVKTVGDLKSETYVKALATELEPLVQEVFRHDESDRFELDVYLGKDPAQRHQALAEQLFDKLCAPLLRVLLRRVDGRWHLDGIQAIGVADIPPQHRPFLLEAAKAFVSENAAPKSQRSAAGRGRLAILWDPKQ